MRGYGHDAYQDGGSLVTTEPTAPEKMTIITAYERVIDLPNNRTRVRAKQSRAFVFAAQAMMEGRPIDQSLDGDVAFDTAAGGPARRVSREVAMRRRMELLAHPVVAVRAALDSGARVTLVERDAATRSDLAISGGLFAAAGTRWQRAAGVEDSPARFRSDVARKTHHSVDCAVLAAVSDASPGPGMTVAPLPQRLRVRAGLSARRSVPNGSGRTPRTTSPGRKSTAALAAQGPRGTTPLGLSIARAGLAVADSAAPPPRGRRRLANC